ncbi:MAG: hypothetical protein GXO73_10325, partial [Calditrichaeota bacterium]|nr:hypothetical protein [Calditrichota bacterium]
MNSSERSGLKERQDISEPRSVSEWLTILTDGPSQESLWLPIYGEAPELWREKARAVEQLLRLHQREFGGDRPVWLLRVPARINLM